MAKYGLATSDANVKKLYDENLFRDVIKEPFFSKLMSDDGTGIVHVKEDLSGKKGDQLYYPLRMRLAGAGVSGNQKLEGNEEALRDYQDSVSLERYRHGVRDDGDLTRQRAVYDVDEEAELAIRDWGTEKIDSLCFTALEATPTRVVYLDSSAAFAVHSTAATALAALHATNSKITLDFLSKMKTWAKTGGARGIIPIKPIMVDGKPHYGLLVHPDVTCDLKLTSEYKSAMRDAETRGKDNPLFTGATAIYDSVIVYEHENVSIGTNGSSVPYCKATLLGRQSLLWAWGRRPKVVYKEFDYDEEHGWAWTLTCGVKKPKFNSLDYGSIGVYLARAKTSDVTVA